ncbi:MAG: hypothetical protein HQK96_12785 [Nitrospirae bacterium]|nr:hypothetical protein [Nitrospirota bacterium]
MKKCLDFWVALHRLNFTVTNRWYADYYEWNGRDWVDAGVRFSYTTDTWVYQGTTDIDDDAVTRTEVLQVGGTVIETLTYKETRYMQGNPNDGALLTWTIVDPLNGQLNLIIFWTTMMGLY